MNNDPLPTVLLIISVVAIVLSVPLILRLVRMNPVYGFRIPEAFRSAERWFQINRFGGVLLLLWGVALGITGVIGLNIGSSHSGRFTLIGVGVLIGGMVLVTAGIFLYAAKTKRN